MVTDEAIIMMETNAPVSSPMIIKPNKQRDASLQKTLSKGSLATTVAMEDLSCDGSSTCRSKSSSSGSFTTPGRKKKSALKMTILMNKSAEFNVDEKMVLPSTEECNDDSFDFKDDSPWWSNSPVKQGKKGATDEPPSRVDEPKRVASNPKLTSEQVDSPVSQPEKLTAIVSTYGTGVEPQQQPASPSSEFADFQALAMNDDNSRSNNDSSIRDGDYTPTSPVKRASKGEIVEGRESPSKRKEKKKQSGKRISVSKVKASDLVNRFFNASGETIADPKELQDAIRLWKAEQRSSLTEVDSTRKEATRGRRSSLDGALLKPGSPQRQRSRSKARLVAGGNADKSTQIRSVSKARRKTKESREKSDTGADLPTAIHPTATATEYGNVSRSRSIVRKATTQAGDDHARSVSLARTSTQGGRTSRGRSVAKRIENDGEKKKRTSSLARGLAKLYNESSETAFAEGQCNTSVFHKSDASRATTRSDDIMVVERRRTHSLARGLTRVSKDDQCRGDIRSQQRTTLSISSDDNAAARRRSRSVGVGLREETAPAPTPTTPSLAPAATVRRTVARRNSTNVPKRRSLSRRREEDDFTKMANLSFQDDGFFASMVDLQHDPTE